MNLLFDFYGSLLTQKQAACFTMRFVHDYSLTEIAAHLGNSPQAVVDFLKRAENGLKQYEKHLKLVRKFQEMQSAVENISADLNALIRDNNIGESEKETVCRIKNSVDNLMLI